MNLYRDVSIWKVISGLIKNKTDEAGPPTTEHQITNLTNRIISASACEWTLWDPSPLSLPLEPPREHSRVRIICLMTPLCITVLYNRPLPYWFGIFSYGLYFFGHCLLKSGTLPSSFTDVWFYFRFAWFVLEGLIVWLSEGGRRGGRGIVDFGICYLRLVATLRMRSFGITSKVYRTDLVWKKLITQGPKGVLSIWLIGNISR